MHRDTAHIQQKGSVADEMSSYFLRTLTLASIACGSTAIAAPTSTISFYVDCSNGNDNSGSGTSTSPWASLAHAQIALRAAQPIASPGATVYVQGDCISRDTNGAFSNNTLLTLTSLDSGFSFDAPITYTAWEGTPRLLGGFRIPPSAWSPAPANIPVAIGTLVADLSSKGLNLAQFSLGSLGGGGLGSCTDSAMELFVDNTPQVLARYPNIASDGTWQWIEINQVIDKQSEYVINGTVDGQHALTWPPVTSWVHGYWSFDWADSYCDIKNISSDGAGNVMITIEPNTPPVYGFLPKARFYGVNILSELDQEGEYYIDVTNELIYWFPLGGLASTKEVFLSISQSLVVATGVSNVIFDSIDFFFARGTAFTSTNSINVTVQKSTSALHGHTAFDLEGAQVTLRDSNIFGTGCRATSIVGGNFMTLAKSGNLIVNNTIHSFARNTRTYNPGIAFFDVGGLYANNTISDGPHTGMTGSGALNHFVGNTLDSLLYEASDAGAFYVGYSWTNRGNVIRNNTFRNILPKEKTFLGYPSVQAVYLDDEQSGYVIEDNICENAMACFFVGGGRDNIIRNNVCRNANVCLHLDNRGMNWQHDSCIYNATYTGRLIQELYAVNYTQPPYSTAFPEIVTTLDRHPCIPVNVSFTGNFACNTSELIDVTQQDIAQWFDSYNNNTNVTTC